MPELIPVGNRYTTRPPATTVPDDDEDDDSDMSSPSSTNKETMTAQKGNTTVGVNVNVDLYDEIDDESPRNAVEVSRSTNKIRLVHS